jgi:hypothetical protein
MSDMRKTYKIQVDGRQWTSNLTEKDVEDLRRHYHGFVSIEPVGIPDDFTLDFEAIAEELQA